LVRAYNEVTERIGIVRRLIHRSASRQRDSRRAREEASLHRSRQVRRSGHAVARAYRVSMLSEAQANKLPFVG